MALNSRAKPEVEDALSQVGVATQPDSVVITRAHVGPNRSESANG